MGLLVTGVLIDDYPMYLLILPLMRHEIGLVLMWSSLFSTASRSSLFYIASRSSLKLTLSLRPSEVFSTSISSSPKLRLSLRDLSLDLFSNASSLRHSHIKPSPSSGSLKFKPSQSQTLFSKALSSQAHSLPLFLSLLKMAKDTWPPEEVRYFFELYAEERRKENRTTSMNKIGKQNIIEAFKKRFKKGFLDWCLLRNKYDTSRKKC
ncbi:hypothetical protein F2Q69_00029136 [Brassica cretica]|uniref:Uncharacterized protein n=1 Tax=Brassica cretica TaxID=69181 RepID=A0A8S9SCD6_BRACR|nr:hypothetical protein F2Q69_00029136 [Brassica cretica]